MKHLLSLILLLACYGQLAQAASTARPNIIFILVDDMGWGDLSCYGNTVFATPHIDRLAKSGMLLTQFYANAPVCSPSRCAFLTSQFPARNGVHTIYGTAEKNAVRGMRPFFDPKVPTIPSILKSAGYRTAHVGKWHLNSGLPGEPPISAYGFDFVGSGEGQAGANIIKTDPYYRAKSSSLFVDEGIQFIEQAGERPFYLELWMLIPHATLNPTPEQMKPFRRFGNPDIVHTPARTIYAASMHDMDQQVGRLLDYLDKRGMSDNTIVIFSSDNGPEDIAVANAAHSGVGSAGPFRGRKRSLYEGGIRMPFLIRWPGKIPAGRVDDTSVVAAVDLMPTLCSAVGVPMPPGHVSDGEDVMDILQGPPRARRNPLMWEWRFEVLGAPANRSPQIAIRDDRWKLLLNPDRSRVELYDLVRDPMEADNVAHENPDIVARLSATVLAWQKRLPSGPVDANAGKNDFPWPRSRKAE